MHTVLKVSNLIYRIIGRRPCKRPRTRWRDYIVCLIWFGNAFGSPKRSCEVLLGRGIWNNLFSLLHSQVGGWMDGWMVLWFWLYVNKNEVCEILTELCTRMQIFPFLKSYCQRRSKLYPQIRLILSMEHTYLRISKDLPCHLIVLL